MSHPGDCYCPGKGYKHLYTIAYTIGASHILATSIAIPSPAIAWIWDGKKYIGKVFAPIYPMTCDMPWPSLLVYHYSGLDHANAEHNAEE